MRFGNDRQARACRRERENTLPLQDIIISRVELDIVLFQIQVQLIGAKDLGNLDKLVVVVMSMEERLFAENLNAKSLRQRQIEAYNRIQIHH